MTELNCENVCLAAMAMMDGARAPLTAEAIENHLANCSGCREEVAQLEALAGLMDAHERRQHGADLWPVVGPQLANNRSRKTSATAAGAFVLLGLLLLAYKLVELIPEADLGRLFKLVPLLLVISVFSYLKENPFKINTSIRLEGD